MSTLIEKGVKIDPTFAEIYNNMGTAYKQKKDYKSAKINYEKSLDLNNKLPETHNNFANLYELLDDFEKSIKHFKAAISINPNFFVAHYGLGNVYITLGKFDEAKRYLQTSIQLQPKFYSAHRALSHITKYKKDDKHLNVLKKLYEDNSVEFERKTELAYALGKAYEDIKNFKSSFKLYKAANLIRRKNINFSINKEKEIFKNIKSVFNLSFFNKYKKSGNPDPSGLFILGMPRSGTTLAAQIISSHPKVYGGNELDFLNEIVLKQYPDFFSNFKQEFGIDIFKKLGDEYISKIRGLSKKSLRIIDKNPSNFKLIGLIKLILPNSKIIHCFGFKHTYTFKNGFTLSKPISSLFSTGLRNRPEGSFRNHLNSADNEIFAHILFKKFTLLLLKG